VLNFLQWQILLLNLDGISNYSSIINLKSPTETAIELGRVLERGLRESRAIDTEALCIIAGEKVWSVRCDIHIVDYGGNLLDCATIATITALLHFRRPFTTVIGNSLTLVRNVQLIPANYVKHTAEDKQPVPLSIHHIPVSISFAIFEEGYL
jgi:exosome complex component RRP45